MGSNQAALVKETEMIKFEAGKTYETRSVCDSDCVISVKIISRTEKSVKAEIRGEVHTFRVKPLYDGLAEMFRPWGNYSMAPIMDATDIVTEA